MLQHRCVQNIVADRAQAKYTNVTLSNQNKNEIQYSNFEKKRTLSFYNII